MEKPTMEQLAQSTSTGMGAFPHLATTFLMVGAALNDQPQEFWSHLPAEVGVDLVLAICVYMACASGEDILSCQTDITNAENPDKFVSLLMERLFSVSDQDYFAKQQNTPNGSIQLNPFGTENVGGVNVSFDA